MKNANFLEEEKINTLLWKFSLPAVVGMVVSALYNVVDSIFVGQGIGTIALTAVTIAFPIMTILMAVGMFVGIGSSALISISMGKKDKEHAELVLGNAITLVVLFVLVTTGIMLYYLDPLLVNLLGATPDVLPYAHDYTMIIIAGSVFLHVGFGINNIIRAQGDPKTALATQIIAAIINIILNYLFVMVFEWGVKGTAIATILAEAVAAFWVLAYFIQGRGYLRLQWKNMSLRWHIVKAISKIGCAPFLMQVGLSAVMVVLNLRILIFGGEIAVAAFGVINRVFMLVLMPVIGVSQGAQPIIGYNYGAKNYPRMIETLQKAVGVATVFCTLCFFGIELFAETIVRLFNEDSSLIAIGAQGMRIFLVMLPAIGLQIIGTTYFQAIGKAGYSALFSILRQIIVLIPLAFVLSSTYGLEGIWFAGPISDALSAILIIVCMLINVRHYKKAFLANTQAV